MTMFGTLVQRLTSPVTSPTSSRRRFKSPSRWEVQSDPEDDPAAPVRKSRAKHLLDKRKSKSRARGLNSSEHTLQMCNGGGGGGGGGWQDIAFPPLRGTKSLGRLDGMKERGQTHGDSLAWDGQDCRVRRESQLVENLTSPVDTLASPFVGIFHVPWSKIA
ncbi:hypothetical protein EAI_00356 [Harpegnathos saltator]|uniref:Uncharacterized protein n=1 Tax=Harpegnathos saltator TaxID=610380 RepID=E2BSH9_HARSA|nr:hypothetical protein EAI_00356 [Harpegnathos saltator]